MRNVLFILAIIIGGLLPQTAKAQTPLLQALIDATPAGGTLTLPADVVYPCNCVIRQAITIQSAGARVVTSNADPAVTILPGVHDVTLRGVDISATGFVYDIVRIGASGNDQATLQNTLDEVPTNITLDHVTIHGDPLSDSQRGVAANGANVSIINSRIYEIHTRGADSQAVCVWNGPGPILIADSYLEAAGENVLVGGADPSIPNLIPSNIQILRNYFFKPLTWKVGDPSYAGIHWSVKNLLELKMARSVTIDGNVLENSWGDAQIGYAVLFTVRNQNGGAPWATIENVTWTNNTVKNSEQGFQLLGSDNLNPSQRASGLTIFNSQFQQIANRFLTMSGYYNVTIEHNTHEQGGNIMSLYGEQSFGFKYVNNVTVRNPNGYGIFGDSVGEGTIAVSTYTPDGLVAGNVIAGADARFYPAGNFYPADLSNLSGYRGTDGLVPGFMGVAPSPSPTPPVPVPDPTPIDASPDGTKAVTITDASGGVWTLGSKQETLRNSIWMSDGLGLIYKWLNSTVYVQGTDGQWYEWTGSWWALLGPVEPGTVNPTPSPTPAGTPPPSPSPSPTATPTPSPSPTPTPLPSPSPSPTPVPTPRCVKFNPKGKCLKWN